jgi:hypothetical protein
MKNARLHWLLRERRAPDGKPYTVGRIADTIYSGRAHVTQVLNGSRSGGMTRRKLVKFFRKEFPGTADEILRCLRWNIPCGTKERGNFNAENAERETVRKMGSEK